MEGKGKRKLEGENEEKSFHQPQHQYARNLQRIFNQESNFKFRSLGSYDEDKELLSPTESEPDDMGTEGIESAEDTEDLVMGRQDQPDLVHKRVLGKGGGIQLPRLRKSDDFVIIDSDLKKQSGSKEEVTIAPRSFRKKHFLSSPYKVGIITP